MGWERSFDQLIAHSTLARGVSYLQKIPAEFWAFVEIDELKPTWNNRDFHMKMNRRACYGAFGHFFFIFISRWPILVSWC